MKLIIDTTILDYYITKYISKPEKRSFGFNEALSLLMDELEEGKDTRIRNEKTLCDKIINSVTG